MSSERITAKHRDRLAVMPALRRSIHKVHRCLKLNCASSMVSQGASGASKATGR